jgi:all-trans-8'-apo-beta-carotenal 15,15'-oxygenase
MLNTTTERRERADMRSIAREHGFLPLRVEGRVPNELDGTLVRTGPGLYERFGRRVPHSFQADGALTGIRLRGGMAEGAIRLCRSEGMIAEENAGRSLFGGDVSAARRIANLFTRRTKNTGNTALMAWQDRLFALVESSPPLEISPDDLSTIGQSDLGGVVTTAFSAHPHRVVSRRATYNFGVAYGPRTELVLYELPWDGRARRMHTIPMRMPVMLHDFAVGARHAVFFVSPARIDIRRALFGAKSFGDIVRWEPERGVEVIVVPLDAPERVSRFTVPAFYQWHFAGVRVRGHELVVHYARYDDLASFEQLARSGITQRGMLHEAIVDPIGHTLTSRPLWDGPSEFPVLDPRFEGDTPSEVFVLSELGAESAIARVDLATGRARTMALGEGRMGSEPIFVPRSEHAAEGDGWLLVLVYDETIDASHLAIFDTARLDDGAIARCHFETHVPMTFHGVWLPRR